MYVVGAKILNERKYYENFIKVQIKSANIRDQK